jgi:hypothetical protein
VYTDAAVPGWVRVRILDGAVAGTRGWVPTGQVVSVSVGTVGSDGELEQLFAALREATFSVNGADVPIPYRYPKDGCYARAEVMARLLAASGYTVDKVFVVSTKGLRISTPHGGDQADYGSPLEVNWWYHVAPVVYAQVDKLPAKPHAFVVDPSVAQVPLTVRDWVGKTTPLPYTEMSYDEMRTRLKNTGAYPGDSAWAIRAGAVVYSLPDRNNPAATSTAGPGDAVQTLAATAALVPAHDVVAGLDQLFRRSYRAMVDNARRDTAAPYPGYPGDLAAARLAIQTLLPVLRLYVRTSFPKFLDDWSMTFLGSGIEGDVKQLRVLLES